MTTLHSSSYYLTHVLQNVNNELNKVTYRLGRCLEEYEMELAKRYNVKCSDSCHSLNDTKSKSVDHNNNTNDDSSKNSTYHNEHTLIRQEQHYEQELLLKQLYHVSDNNNNNNNINNNMHERKLAIIIQRMGRLRVSALVLCEKIKQCLKNKMNSNHEKVNILEMEQESKYKSSKMLVSEEELRVTDNNNSSKNEDKEVEKENDNCNDTDEHETRESDKLIETYKLLLHYIAKANAILTAHVRKAISSSAHSQTSEQEQEEERLLQELSSSSITMNASSLYTNVNANRNTTSITTTTNSNCNKINKLNNRVWELLYCPLSLIGATASEWQLCNVMCNRHDKLLHFNNVSNSNSNENRVIKKKCKKDSSDSNMEKRVNKEDDDNNTKAYTSSNVNEQNYERKEEKETASSTTLLESKESVMLNQVNIDKADKAKEKTGEGTKQLHVPYLIRVDNSHQLWHRSRNAMSPLCYSEEHIICKEHEVKESKYDCDDKNVKVLSSLSEQSVNNTCNVIETTREELIESNSSTALANDVRYNNCQNKSHVLQSTATPSALRSAESESKLHSSENKELLSQQHEQQEEKEMENVVLEDIKHAIHSMKTSALQVSEIIQEEQSHFTSNAQRLTKQVHSTEVNIQQINQLSAVRTSHSNALLQWLEQLPAGNLLVHSLLLPLWGVVKQMIYFTIIIACTLMTLILINLFHKPHRYKSYHTFSEITHMHNDTTFDTITNVSSTCSNANNNYSDNTTFTNMFSVATNGSVYNNTSQ